MNPLKRTFRVCRFAFQKLLLHCSAGICRLFVRPVEDLWVLGVDEVANSIFQMAKAFNRHYSVNLTPHAFYLTNTYDFDLSRVPLGFRSLVRFFASPILLGYLVNKASGFLYIWNTGFLGSELDGRYYEFSFLKRRGKQIAAYFCGTDIRAPRLAMEQATELDIDVLATWQVMLHPSLLSDAHDRRLRAVAHSADTFADDIFNPSADQISYIQRDVHPYIYFLPSERFVRRDKKFEDMTCIRIVHAPSSPFIKGTPLVRAAVKKLKVLGFQFEYVEIKNSDNQVVLDQMARAHIVVNQLYAFVPSVAGIEAMASHAALVTSADKNIERSLPDDSNEAWCVTRYWEVFDKLHMLLANPELIKEYADRGFDWALREAASDAAEVKLRSILSKQGTESPASDAARRAA